MGGSFACFERRVRQQTRSLTGAWVVEIVAIFEVLVVVLDSLLPFGVALVRVIFVLTLNRKVIVFNIGLGFPQWLHGKASFTGVLAVVSQFECCFLELPIHLEIADFLENTLLEFTW